MNTKIRTFLRVAIIVIVAWFIVAWFLVRAGWPRKEICNVVLISIDTCRADYLSCYGCRRPTTPNIDMLAAEGVLFENVIAPVPLTLPSHSSMLTGTIPPYHGIHDNLDYSLGGSNLTLAEILKDAGFATGAVIGAFVMDSQFGLDQGFDTYNDKFDEALDTIGIIERRASEVSRHALKWLDEHKNERFFLFLHYYDPHNDYVPPEPFASKFPRNPYAGEIAYTDHCIGQVIEKLKDLGLYDSSLIIITSDHGEMLGEHGENTHAYFIYRSALRVPLLFKLPGHHKARRINSLVGLVDIVPTVCSLLGIEPPAEVHGEDLSGYLGRKKPRPWERHIYCESLYPTKYNANSLLGVVTDRYMTDRYKYIQTTRPELYDLSNDPWETNNLVTKEPHRARILQDRLKLILEEQVRKSDPNSKFELDVDEQSRQRLESLGYVAGSVTEDFEFDESKEDPKDLIDLHESYLRASYLILQEKYAEARESSEKMVEQWPDFFGAHLNLSKIAMEQNDFAGAAPHLYKALELKSDRYEVHNNLGMVLVHLEKFEEAIKCFEEALYLRPDKAMIHNNFGFALLRQGRLDQAIERCTKALELDPELAEAHHNLGLALTQKGEFDEAVRHYTEAVRLEPDRAGRYKNLGSALAQQNKIEEAAVNYRKSLELDPNQPEVLNALGATLVKLEKLNEALASYAKSLEFKADQPIVNKIVADIFYQQTKLDDATVHYTQALELEPNMPLVQNSLGEIYFQQGKLEQAIGHWTEALKLKPDWPQVLNNLAWCKAAYDRESFHDPNEAVQFSQKACELTEYKQASLLDTLSIAYAAVDRFSEAIETAEKAIELAVSSGQNELAEEIKKHLELYKAGQPYSEVASKSTGE